MVNILVSVNPDLASSIAIRYAGQLAHFMEIALQPIHVKEPEQKGSLFGTGWVRHTWEHALAEKGEEEINLLIRTEKPYCPALAAPRVVVGERENEILKELQTGAYDLFMEGILASFDEGDFKKLITSKLYQSAPCPAIVVKNLVPLEKVALLSYVGLEPSKLVDDVSDILRQAKLPLDVIHLVPKKDKKDLEVNEEAHEAQGFDNLVDAIRKKGLDLQKGQVLTGHPKDIADYLSRYGLVVCAVRNALDKKSPIHTVLAFTPSPIFIC
ncbi:MAG: universal stress protein [Deltaproteobacteria bacterium]|nr:universal stress protein [Deltaproteobacteria bacterium]MBW2082534.1 universal stress protein [Deltaproteobacteria bacterium]HDM09430.1 universal stress protein [Desulfobacteraceae bacterium]